MNPSVQILHSVPPAFRTIIKLGSSGITDLIVLNLDFSAGASNAKLQFKYADGSLVLDRPAQVSLVDK